MVSEMSVEMCWGNCWNVCWHDCWEVVLDGLCHKWLQMCSVSRKSLQYIWNPGTGLVGVLSFWLYHFHIFDSFVCFALFKETVMFILE